MLTGNRALTAAAYAVPVVVFLAVYAPAAGHGFISDDFGWILHNRLRSTADLSRIAVADNGFYRPAVAFSFALNELAFGLNARAYGLTNLALAALCGAGVYLLARALALPRGAAGLAACLWLLNLHGVNMAILWISGRTALIATAAAAACMAALLRGRSATAGILFAVALFAREDAVLLAVVSVVWLAVLRPTTAKPAVPPLRWLVVTAVIVAAYFLIRSTTDAMTPATAPSYYRLTIEPATLVRNVAEYADRTLTFSLAVLVVLAILLRPGRRLIDLASARDRAVITCGMVWTGTFLVPALLLPVRSSLYACLPSAGACVAAAAIASRWWSTATPVRRQRAMVAAVVIPLLLWPVYHGRTKRWVALAEFSTQALTELEAATRGVPDDSNILIVDDRTPRANVASVFSTLLRDAYLLSTNRFMNFYVDPAIPNASDISGGLNRCNGCEDVRLAVTGGRLAVVK